VMKPPRLPQGKLPDHRDRAAAGVPHRDGLPLARLRIDHEMSARPDGTEFRHRLSTTGPLAWLFWRLFGRQLAASLPGDAASIARLSELDHAR